jgi:threonine dehydratase
MACDGLVTLADIEEAYEVVKASPGVRRTPLLGGFELGGAAELLLKLENVQCTGSFKIRGMTNVFSRASAASKACGAVTMSAGNAGRSFATLAASEGVDGVVVMPHGVPASRRRAIEACGARVESAEMAGLQARVDELVREEGRFYVHPFDAKALIAGHASCGLEIAEQCPDADVILVCCGGGGLVSGIAAAAKLVGGSKQAGGSKQKQPRVYAVEPEGAPTMHESLRAGAPAALAPGAHTIAHGLAAPFAGPVSFEHVRAFVDGVILVTDDDLRAATRLAYGWGLVAETSGCAGIAALLAGKVPGGVAGLRVVAVVSGSNIGVEELAEEAFGLVLPAGGDRPPADAWAAPWWALLGLACGAAATAYAYKKGNR